jgi:hypothetical protein
LYRMNPQRDMVIQNRTDLGPRHRSIRDAMQSNIRIESSAKVGQTGKFIWLPAAIPSDRKAAAQRAGLRFRMSVLIPGEKCKFRTGERQIEYQFRGVYFSGR